MREDEIFLCFDCGTKNRIRSGVPGVPKCGSCGATLRLPEAPRRSEPAAPAAKNKAPAVAEGNDAHAPSSQETGGQKRGFLPGWLITVGISAAIFFLPYLAQRQGQRAVEEPAAVADRAATRAVEQAYAPPTEEPQPVLLPVHQDPGIMYNRTGRPRLAPFELVTKPGSDYYVKLVELPSNRDAVGIYVKGGQRIDLLVPVGSYELRYAAGETWYGVGNLFGPKTTYTKASGRFDFTRDRGGYNGYTVELIAQLSGNLRTSQIAPSEF